MSEALVRSLLRDKRPDLAELPLTEVSGGWDNQLWRLDEELAVRLPRTDRAPALSRRELRSLPELAAELQAGVDGRPGGKPSWLPSGLATVERITRSAG